MHFEEIDINLIEEYSEKIKQVHEVNEKNSGYEINDRRFFVDYILKGLGYKDSDVLIDVPQTNYYLGTRSADIRIFGANEIKKKTSHSQFVIETKNYRLYREKAIDFLQLKRYIKYNEAKIRIIAATDYEKMYVFNATMIKKNSRMNLSKLDSINEIEKKIFKENLLYELNLINLEDNEYKELYNLSYKKVFSEQKFINPAEYEKTNSLSIPDVRKNFIMVLYHLMINLQSKIYPVFQTHVLLFIPQIYDIKGKKGWKKQLDKLLEDKEHQPILNYLLWCVEMNYLDEFIFNESQRILSDIEDILNDSEKKDSFVLTSVYSVINKLMFIRILEDSSTETTKFIEGNESGRYISNGILEKKRKEGTQALAQYIISIFNFEYDDFEPYSFILKKDIYNWVLLFSDNLIADLLIELIRLFNDTNFKSINQDLLGDIYEHYLEQDEDEIHRKNYRRLLGQYYTPKPIVRLMWYLTRTVIQQRKGRDIYIHNQNNLDIIDPACGSGTFLVEASLQMNESYSNRKIDKNGTVYSFVNDEKVESISNNIYGFELNPLSKTICDINLFFSMVQTYGMKNLAKKEISKLNTYRTDSLELNVEVIQESKVPSFMMMPEIRNSLEKKDLLIEAKKKKYDIVIGNPPYGYTTPTMEMKNVFIPYAYAENNFNNNQDNIEFGWNNKLGVGKVPQNEKNIGKIADLYAFFFGLGDKLVKDDGVISFITSNTYLSIPSYKWFRKYLLENYTIEYLINFNPISSKENSMFFPDAGIATSIIIMSKTKCLDNHQIKVMDLSDYESIKEKYEFFADIEWINIQEKKYDKNDIKSFTIKPLKKINFKYIQQKNLLKNVDYVFNLNVDEKEELLSQLIKKSERITTFSRKHTGVDVGDLNLLVTDSREELKENIENKVFNRNLVGYSKTIIKKIQKSFKDGVIQTAFDESRVKLFIYQSDMEPYNCLNNYYTYHDKAIMWRARYKEGIKTEPINRKYKLFIREKRGNKSSINSVVNKDYALPQHGGRFMYMVDDENITIEDLYVMSGLINSKVSQYIYRFGVKANKEVYILNPKKIESISYKEILDKSMEIHETLYDFNSIINGDASFNSNYFKEKNKVLEDMIFKATDNNIYFNLVIKNKLYVDYEINCPQKKDDGSIRLNEDITLYFMTDDIHKDAVFNFFVSCNGKSIQDVELNMFNVQKLDDVYQKEVDDYVEYLMNQIDEIIYNIYNLTRLQIEQIEKDLF